MDIEEALNEFRAEYESSEHWDSDLIISLECAEVISAELDKKDKIIYNLAFALADYVMYYEYDKCRNPEMIKNKAKEKIDYFTNKVEEDK